MTRRRRRQRQPVAEPTREDELRIHRELQYLRAVGLTRRRKPSAARRIRGRSGGYANPDWVSERWRKLRDVDRGSSK